MNFHPVLAEVFIYFHRTNYWWLGLTIFHSWQNMKKDWADKKKILKQNAVSKNSYAWWLMASPYTYEPLSNSRYPSLPVDPPRLPPECAPGCEFIYFRCSQWITLAKFGFLTNSVQMCDEKYSHTFLIDNHVRLHSSQNVSYTGNVCDLHLRLTAKPHICVICGTFHTEVNTHLRLCSTHNLLIKR